VPEELAEYQNALPLKTMLHEYRLDAVLGAGGFGITYLAWDTNLEKHVAIKEYLPGDLAMRALDGSVLPVNTDNKHNYQWGLERFMKEARTLAKFSHPNIVRVNRYFEANGTSYMVMDYEAGESLHQVLRRTPPPDEAALTAIVMPILDGLQAVHQAGFLHRDIKPSNVFIRKDGTPVLLDFGSSRFAGGGEPRNLTAIVSPGYAPLEQYSGDGNQGPWSDIYALAGVLFRAVTGEHPPDAVRRLKSDTVGSSLTTAQTRFSAPFLKAIECGLNRDEKLRPQSVAQWRALFVGGPAVEVPSGRPGAAPVQPTPGTARPLAATAPNSGTRTGSRGSAVRASRAPRDDPPAGTAWKWIGLAAMALAAVLALVLHLRNRAADLESRGIANQPPRQAPQPTFAPPAPAPNAPREADIPPALLKEFRAADRNADGYLTPHEVEGRFPFIAANFPSVDTDGDGRISPGELWQLRKRQREMKQR
jgi:hypothetical protein